MKSLREYFALERHEYSHLFYHSAIRLNSNGNTVERICRSRQTTAGDCPLFPDNSLLPDDSPSCFTGMNAQIMAAYYSSGKFWGVPYGRLATLEHPIADYRSVVVRTIGDESSYPINSHIRYDAMLKCRKR